MGQNGRNSWAANTSALFFSYEMAEEHPAEALDRVHGWGAKIKAVKSLGFQASVRVFAASNFQSLKAL